MIEHINKRLSQNTDYMHGNTHFLCVKRGGWTCVCSSIRLCCKNTGLCTAQPIRKLVNWKEKNCLILYVQTKYIMYILYMYGFIQSCTVYMCMIPWAK